MHDISLFLFKNWLPVGLSAIAFCIIGLLFAKSIWGRFSQRLYFAVEENLNLASQWSALVTSQRDLFKKLRSRWQDDRDGWELRLAESEQVIAKKDSRIEELIRALSADGKVDLAELAQEKETGEQIAALEATVAEKESEIAELKSKVKSAPSAIGFSNPVESKEADSSRTAELQSRIRDLEQDLIDTHDELHDVRSGYRQQVDLVESLEARLIDAPDSDQELEDAKQRIAALEAELADNGAASRRAAQLGAIAAYRSRELFAFRNETVVLKSDMSRLSADLEDAKDSTEHDERIAELTDELGAVGGNLERVSAELAERNDELETAQRKLEALEPIVRRHDLLKVELSDAFHEMYDVRTALKNRLDEIEILEACLDEVDGVEEERDALADELSNTRRELSEVRMSLNEKLEEFERRKAEMEELEAIIEDRGAEVNDLSAEVREKRDLVRQLKNKLAEHEGELEGLNDEARKTSAALASKTAFSEEQTRRIADLEIMLGEHYDEMNVARARWDDEAKSAKYHASRSKQLEDELERRDSEFAASHRKIATTENALEAANQQISLLTEQLEQSDFSIAKLGDDVRRLSQEKDDTLRQLDETTKRVEELENAAAVREQKLKEYQDSLQSRDEDLSERDNRITELEEELAGIVGSLEERETLAAERAEKVQELEALLAERKKQLDVAASRVSQVEQEISDKNEYTERLALNLERLNSELESATREKESSQAAIAKLEESLQASDTKTLTLSQQLDEKHREIARFESDLAIVRDQLTARETAVAESEQRITELEEQLEERQKSQSDADIVHKANQVEITRLTEEIKSQQGHLNRYAQQKEESLSELERLRSKVEKRGTSIRELQSQISSIMMQRASRDNEISLLKDKLRAVEAELRKAGESVPPAGAEDSEPISSISLEAAIKKSLAVESDNPGASLDELEESESHHQLSEPAKPAPVQQPQAGESEDMAVYFDESSDGLSDDALKKIDRCAQTFRQSGKKFELTVIGFAGSEGSSNFTESLAARRADSVRQRFLQRGIPQNRINVQSAGQDRRFSDWKARRVEMILAPRAVAETIN